MKFICVFFVCLGLMSCHDIAQFNGNIMNELDEPLADVEYTYNYKDYDLSRKKTDADGNFIGHCSGSNPGPIEVTITFKHEDYEDLVKVFRCDSKNMNFKMKKK